MQPLVVLHAYNMSLQLLLPRIRVLVVELGQCIDLIRTVIYIGRYGELFCFDVCMRMVMLCLLFDLI